jgi:hypothetical protein
VVSVKDSAPPDETHSPYTTHGTSLPRDGGSDCHTRPLNYSLEIKELHAL